MRASSTRGCRASTASSMRGCTASTVITINGCTTSTASTMKVLTESHGNHLGENLSNIFNVNQFLGRNTLRGAFTSVLVWRFGYNVMPLAQEKQNKYPTKKWNMFFHGNWYKFDITQPLLMKTHIHLLSIVITHQSSETILFMSIELLRCASMSNDYDVSNEEQGNQQINFTTC